MNTHLQSLLVTEASAWIIIHLAITDDHRTRLGDLGACEIVYRALKFHKISPVVCECLCWAIKNLSYQNDANRCKFGSIGACEEVVDILAKHPSNAPVSRAVWGAIVNLSCENCENKLRFDDLGELLGLGFMKY